jgi:hypothetical protein
MREGVELPPIWGKLFGCLKSPQSSATWLGSFSWVFVFSAGTDLWPINSEL